MEIFLSYPDKSQAQLPWVRLDHLEKLLRQGGQHFSPNCPACASFFPTLLNDLTATVNSFNERAQHLIDRPLARGFKKYLGCISKLRDQNTAFQDGMSLLIYANWNALAVHNILQEYDKIHSSKLGQTFKCQVQLDNIDLLKSPWLPELMSFLINLQEKKMVNNKVGPLYEASTLSLEEGKPSLTCAIFSFNINIDLTCSICLEMAFEPVALKCGHILCHTCACSAALVTIADGLKTALAKEKCPLCRKAGVYTTALHLQELGALLKKRCPKWWKQQANREDRLHQTKKYGEMQCAVFRACMATRL